MEKECVEFSGHTYYRYPQSPHKHLQLYYWPSRLDREKYGLEVLHREIWKANHGPIPEGCLIHHKDTNRLNNDPGNLECVTRQEHGERHCYEASEELLEHLERIRGKASEWHRSEEGRQWHREHGAKVWQTVQSVTKVCDYCHQEFETKQNRRNVRFCSRRCRQRWLVAHKAHHIDKVCPICGAAYSTTKYDPAVTCSKKCAAYWRNTRDSNG